MTMVIFIVTYSSLSLSLYIYMYMYGDPVILTRIIVIYIDLWDVRKEHWCFVVGFKGQV